MIDNLLVGEFCKATRTLDGKHVIIFPGVFLVRRAGRQ
jgi:hypothetical protein